MSYVFGVDFGTLSARAVLVSTKDGRQVATAHHSYPHGVLDHHLPTSELILPPDWALQDPHDYIECLSTVFWECLTNAGVTADEIIGIGVDFTECTLIPVKADATPLCFLSEFSANPHAYVKLWKHHGAQPEGIRLNKIAKSRRELFLERYGGKISCETLFPKVMEILADAPEVFEAADRLMEAADWIPFVLTGKETRNSCTAGWKALWQKDLGHPSAEFLKALDPRLEDMIARKMRNEIAPIGSRAGGLSEAGAKLTGLRPGTPVAVGCGDGHVAVIGAGITKPAVMLMVLGTSGCNMIMSDVGSPIPGFCGVVEDGLLPGYFGFEAGQASIGDLFQWFADNCVSSEYLTEAEEKGISIMQYLDEEASRIKPGSTGLIALDWWNGNRSILVDSNLSGLIIGMTLATTSIEIYRALVEGVAFGQRMIIEAFLQSGSKIEEIIAVGGIAERSPFTIQTLADVINMPIKLSTVQNATAMGSAVLGAVAAGVDAGGFATIQEAADHFAVESKTVVTPNPDTRQVYNSLFHEYVVLHEYFGRTNRVMKNLRKLKGQTR
jgi:L-ribulokinase